MMKSKLRYYLICITIVALTLCKQPLTSIVTSKKGQIRPLRSSEDNSSGVDTDTHFGGYVVQEDPDRDKFCSGVDDDDLYMNESKRQSFQNKLNRYFTSSRTSVENIIKIQSSDDSDSSKKSQTNTQIRKLVIGLLFPYGVPIFIAILTPFMFLGLCIWCSCFSWCPCSCLIKKKEYNAEKRWDFLVVAGTTITITFAIVVAVIVWMTYGILTVNSVNYGYCSTISFYSDFRYGISSDQNGQVINFIGVEGVNYLAIQTVDTLESLIHFKVPPSSLGLKTKGDEISKNLDAFFQDFGQVTTSSCANNGKKYSPGCVTLLNSMKPALNTEQSTIKTTSELVTETYQFLDELNKNGDEIIATTTEGLQAFQKVLDDFDSDIEGIKETILESADPNTVTGIGYFVIVLIGLTSICFICCTFMLVYLSMARDTMRKCSNFLFRFIMISAILFSFLINLFVTICFIVSAVLTNSCYYADQVFNNRDMAQQLLPDMYPLFDTCLYSDSTGNLGSLIGVKDLEGFDYMEVIIDGIDSITDTIAKFGITDTPPVSNTFYNEAIPLVTSEQETEWAGYGTNGEEGAAFLKTEINGLSSQTCLNHKNDFQLNESLCKEALPVAQYQQSIVDNTYCLVPSIWDFGINDWATDCTKGAEITTKYTSLNSCVKDHDTKLSKDSQRMDQIYQNQVLEKQKVVLQTFDDLYKNSIPELNEKMKSVVSMIDDLGGSLVTSLDCRIIRREFSMFQNTACYQFTYNFLIQSFAIAFLGFFLFCLSMCLCCSIICNQAYNTQHKNFTASGGQDYYIGEDPHEYKIDLNYDNFLDTKFLPDKYKDKNPFDTDVTAQMFAKESGGKNEYKLGQFTQLKSEQSVSLDNGPLN